MKISSIDNGKSCNFKSLYLTQHGAEVLADSFEQDPKLEKEFVSNIVKPLDVIDGDVVFNGYTTTYKFENKEGQVIDSCYCTPSNVAMVSENFSRKLYKNRSDYAPTNDFLGIWPLREIEAAKNIVFDMYCYKNKLAVEEYSRMYGSETKEEKAKRLYEQFKHQD